MATRPTTDAEQTLDDLLSDVENTLRELQRLYMLLEQNATLEIASDALGEAQHLVIALENLEEFLAPPEEE